jgi:hypothetical protein
LIVQKTGILILNLNESPFSGGAFGARVGCGMSQNEQTIYFGNNNVHFRDMQQRISVQNGPNIYAHVPFWAILILNLNDLPFLGHAIFCAFS